ncbi:hypothetical protein [Actinophytocola glycyrrhizae]|uniref:Asp23/Gls24 family envelope stress response protein n=1 Tax=Actinophytocola glycyrrhizae TaxID=2044873 RepID=A0ABV9S6S4_9PSEU
MTATTGSVAEVLLAALRTVPELRPATPRVERFPWDLDLLSVDVGPEVVEVRLVALALPLPPLLRRAETALRQALAGVGREKTLLRLVVTDIDATA